MKTGSFKNTAVFCLALARLFAAPGQAEALEKEALEVSREIISYARENGVRKISVLGFTPEGGAGESEADEVSRIISFYLTVYKRAPAEEWTGLKENFAAAKRPPAGDSSRRLQAVFSVDAAVTGRVVSSGREIKISAGLIDTRTGRVIFSAGAGNISVRKDGPPAAAAALKGIPGDLRDSVADTAGGSCPARRLRLAELNSRLVEAKAAYWAAKMREPLFRSRTAGKNPGIGIADPAVRSRFYGLLADYYQSGKKAAPPDRPGAVLDLLERETRFFAECGLP